MRAAKRRAPPLTNKARGFTWTGGCFQLAGRVLLEAIEAGDTAWLLQARLCHGEVRDSFHPCRWIDHAWVEQDAEAVTEDGSMQRIRVALDLSQPDPRAKVMPLEFFLAKTQARNVRRYTAPEMLRNAMRTHSDGPWPMPQQHDHAAGA